MNDIKSVWHGDLPCCPEQDLKRISDAAAPALADVCRYFYLYRFLHQTATPRATLTGDYCFARFSKSLSELDSVELTDAFADYLKEDTVKSRPLDSYPDFIRKLPAVTAHGA
ncbi:MAG: hypothetical protein FWG32_02300 [Oscillospiraceae bacterium]|nr:hypothetical protein [Oscillospiraceae bacterium]